MEILSLIYKNCAWSWFFLWIGPDGIFFLKIIFSMRHALKMHAHICAHEFLRFSPASLVLFIICPGDLFRGRPPCINININIYIHI